jgi:hypothetical protein
VRHVSVKGTDRLAEHEAETQVEHGVVALQAMD